MKSVRLAEHVLVSLCNTSTWHKSRARISSRLFCFMDVDYSRLLPLQNSRAHCKQRAHMDQSSPLVQCTELLRIWCNPPQNPAVSGGSFGLFKNQDGQLISFPLQHSVVKKTKSSETGRYIPWSKIKVLNAIRVSRAVETIKGLCWQPGGKWADRAIRHMRKIFGVAFVADGESQLLVFKSVEFLDERGWKTLSISWKKTWKPDGLGGPCRSC